MMPVTGPAAARFSGQAKCVPSGEIQARGTGSHLAAALSYAARLWASFEKAAPGRVRKPPLPAWPWAGLPSVGASPEATGSLQPAGVADALGVGDAALAVGDGLTTAEPLPPAEQAASARNPASAKSRLRGLPTYLRHALFGLDIAVGPDLEGAAFLLGPDRRLDHAPDVVIGDTRAHEVAQRRLAERKEAGAQAPLGRQPDPVAGVAEGLADRGDEADPAGRAVGELELDRRTRPRLGRRHQRELVLDRFLDAQAGHHQLGTPDAIAVQRHELDEAHLVALVAG